MQKKYTILISLFFNLTYCSGVEEPILPNEIWLEIVDYIDINDQSFIYLALRYGAKIDKIGQLNDKISGNPDELKKWLKRANNISYFGLLRKNRPDDRNEVIAFKKVLNQFESIDNEFKAFYYFTISGKADDFLSKINSSLVNNIQNNSHEFFKCNELKILSLNSLNNIKNDEKKIILNNFTYLLKRVDYYKNFLHNRKLFYQLIFFLHSYYEFFIVATISPIILGSILKKYPKAFEYLKMHKDLFSRFIYFPIINLLIGSFISESDEKNNRFIFLIEYLNQFDNLIKARLIEIKRE